MSTSKVTLELYAPQKTVQRILGSDDVGVFLASTWAKYFAKYVPMDTGTLQSNVTIDPFEVVYESPYAHYIWAGEKYVDPVYNVGGFHNADFSQWWSRPGVTKIPSGEPLKYNTEKNPLATSHWEEPAFQAFSGSVANQLTQYLRAKR